MARDANDLDAGALVPQLDRSALGAVACFNFRDHVCELVHVGVQRSKQTHYGRPPGVSLAALDVRDRRSVCACSDSHILLA
jgi:hypothetical protein